MSSVIGSCSDTCTPSPNQLCSYTDFGNKQGPLCYSGVFGINAELVGCSLGDVCKTTVSTDPFTQLMVVSGSCDSSCAPLLNAVQCTQTDFGNKQGPICFVGQFGDWSPPTACLKGQVCQVRLHFNSVF